MIKLFINDADRSAYLEDGSLSIVDQIQQKANTAYFNLNPGVTAPSENQDVKLWDVVEIVSASGTAIVVKDELKSGLSILTFDKFRAGEYFWLGIGNADQERATISAIAEGAVGQVNITLSESITGTHVAGDFAGKLIFAGVLTRVTQKNPKLLATVEYQCSATDYTKIFDKKLINDSWADVDARYIFNDALNTTINYNREIDDMDYVDNTAIQAEWIESGDGGNPTVDTTNELQGTSAGSFPWTNSGGTATFSATPASADLSDLVGASSGTPTEGNFTLWYQRASAAGITSVMFRIGSDSSNYAALTLDLEADTDVHFARMKFADATITGTPVWTACDYVAVVITETTSSSILIDDLRVTAEGSFTMFNFEETSVFDDVHAAFKKPTSFIDRLADTLSYYWFIDYEKDIHFFDRESTDAPYSITDTSNNFDNLVVDVDTSQLKNRQTVRGGTKTSDSFYTQVVEGDGETREWLLKSQFEGLLIYMDDNTSTDTMEATTTTTTVKATTHGLADGDYIVNRSRSNAVRKITYVDADTFTVEAVTSQASGDTFSKFATQMDVGVEYLVDETTVDYVSNYNEKSIRAVDATTTLTTGTFLLFKYYEIIPIRVQVSDLASVASLKALVGGDGIFDGAVITDESLDSTQAARDRAQAEVDAYSNPIVKVSFKTDHEGLSSGQLLPVTDTAKGIDDTYVIQRVKVKYQNDFPQFEVQCASSLFGLIEYFQKLSEQSADRMIDDDEVIDQIITENVSITITEAHSVGASEEVSESATITVTETSNAVTERSMTTDPYLWQPDASDSRWNLAQWG